MVAFIRSLRPAPRALLRNPAFAFAAVSTLALGVAACALVFSLFDAVALRPLPYGNAARLVMIWDQLPKLGIEQLPPTIANYFDYREQSHSFDDAAAFTYAELNLAGSADAPPERIQALAATPNLFGVLGVAPVLGRAFRPGDGLAGSDNVALLSHDLWTRRFGADRAVIGTRVRLNDRMFEIVGVMGPDTAFTVRDGPPPDIWIPLPLRRAVSRTAGAVRVIAAIKRGATLERAQADVSAVAAAIQAAWHPYTGPHGEEAGYRVRVVPLRQQLFGDFETPAWILFAAVLFVLVIACANVANLLVSQRLSRTREFAIRTALGARWRHFLGELAAEAAIFACCGGAIGLVGAWWAIRVLPALTPIAERAHVRLDWRVALFTMAIVSVAALLAEMAGGWWVIVRSQAAGLKTRVVGGEMRRSGAVLVAAEAALTFVLLAGAGVMIQSFWKLAHAPVGFDPRGVLTMRVTLPQYKYARPPQKTAFFANAVSVLERIPAVDSAAAVSVLPLNGRGPGGDPFSIDGRPYRLNGSVPQVAAYYIATPNCWQTMRIPLLAGRLIDSRDGPDAMPVAVVSETLARGFWPRIGDAIGQRVMMGAPRPGAQWLTIVGVVGAIRNSGPRLTPIPQIYAAASQNPVSSMSLLIRTSGDPLLLAMPARRAVAQVDPEQPVYDIRTLQQQVSNSVSKDRFQAVLLGCFALTALLLACVGVYSVLERSLSRRTAEIGVRVAVGAQPRDILALVLAQGMKPALVGMVVGLAGALAMSRVLRSLLFETSPLDARMLAVAAAALGMAALAACVAPLRKALRVDAAAALRTE
jgi:putative ABC transport system permease protein